MQPLWTQEEILLGKTLLINKPLHWTSFDVVGYLRKIFKIKKIGHAGTLDPLATGLLIVCTGKYTKKINDYMGMEKEYTGTITLGATTPTYDLESNPENEKPIPDNLADLLQEATTHFVGEIEQVPPAHSAIKIDGKRVYELARKGEEVKLKARKVTIHHFSITRMAPPEIDFRVVCSTGTYIRSLAHDLGQALGCGGYLSGLQRTRIGAFRSIDALQPTEVAHYFDATTIAPKPPKTQTQKKSKRLTPAETELLKNGIG